MNTKKINHLAMAFALMLPSMLQTVPAQASTDECVGAALSKKEQKRFDDLAKSLGLDKAELREASKAAGPYRDTRTNQFTEIVITPNNVKTMPLGASLWATGSQFARRSIFDMGILSQASLIPNLNGATESGMSSRVSSRTSKEANSDKFTWGFTVAARFGGFQAAGAFKQETANEKTAMGGKTVATIYSYSTNTLRIEDGPQIRELRGALRGKMLGPDEVGQYIRTELTPAGSGAVSDEQKYLRVTSCKVFDGRSGPSAMSPRAHIEALIKMEELFSRLKDQYHRFSGQADIQANTRNDMVRVKNQIQASIKSFYANHGDSFAYEVSGYAEIVGQGEAKQKSEAQNKERNNAGSMTAGYNSFVGGADVSVSMGDWAKDAKAYGASEITTTVFQRPNNNIDLAAYDKSLKEWLNQSMNGTSSGASLPVKTIEPSVPNAPTPRSWQEDPFAPPASAFKDLNEWKESRKLYKDSKGFKKPKWLKDEKPNLTAEQQKDNLVKGAGKQGKVGEISESVVKSQLDKDETENKTKSLSFVKGEGVSAASRSKGKLYGLDSYNHILYELKALKAYGKQLKAEERKLLKKAQSTTSSVAQAGGVWIAAELPASASQEMILDKMMVSSFKAIPFTSVLEALRPNLDLPEPPVPEGLEGFLNVSNLLITLNRYQTVDTYLNFIKSIPESGLSSTDIPSNFRKFVNHLDGVIMRLVNASMTSGKDIADMDMIGLLNTEIVGLVVNKDGASIIDPKKTELYKRLGNNRSAYNYVYDLVENFDKYRIIGQAPGGYLPLAAKRGGGYCLPIWDKIDYVRSFRNGNGYYPVYMRDRECRDLTASTSIQSLLGGKPQTPLYPLFRYLEKLETQLSFVQFIGGYRLVIGRDVSYAPPLVDLTSIPGVNISPAIKLVNQRMGYNQDMSGKAEFEQSWNLSSNMTDGRTRNPYDVNAFLPADLSWNHGLWFDGQDESDSYKKFQVLAVRIGMYSHVNSNPDSTLWWNSRGVPQCDLSNRDYYCPVTTYHLLAPYSYQFNPDDPKNNYGLTRISEPPADNFLAERTGGTDEAPTVRKISLRDFGHAANTHTTGGLMLLYPLTSDMIKLPDGGPEAFSYSSGSSPKDVYNKSDNGDSPFDAGYTRGLLQQ